MKLFISGSNTNTNLNLATQAGLTPNQVTIELCPRSRNVYDSNKMKTKVSFVKFWPSQQNTKEHYFVFTTHSSTLKMKF